MARWKRTYPKEVPVSGLSVGPRVYIRGTVACLTSPVAEAWPTVSGDPLGNVGRWTDGSDNIFLDAIPITINRSPGFGELSTGGPAN